jgi:hypothetical protein
MSTIVLQLLMLAVVAYLVLHLVQPAAWHGSRARGLIWAGLLVAAALLALLALR